MTINLNAIKERIFAAVETGVKAAGRLGNRAVTIIKTAVATTSQQMRNDSRIAGGVFVGANLVFLPIAYKVSNWAVKFFDLETTDNSYLSKDKLASFGINSGILFGLNYGLNAATNYSVGLKAISAISVAGAVVLYTLGLCGDCKKGATPANKNPVNKDVPPAPVPPEPNPAEETPVVSEEESSSEEDSVKEEHEPKLGNKTPPQTPTATLKSRLEALTPDELRDADSVQQALGLSDEEWSGLGLVRQTQLNSTLAGLKKSVTSSPSSSNV